ncbi:hypothetical protein EWM64_g10513 [Hericium alpestre]|uniref:DDE-1 domain-containing protein n=1 Tax=Hericium alpestre TaxID=135208 RepID=A0A4Y9ZJ69_9AGAM|nr:hypothetical protein EWM64_g10513 [Hericium alpestre]
MKSYVNKILAPYFATVRAAHGDPPNQLAIWQIDAWSVHRSAEFHAWMAKHHPRIQLKYVPGGCTGIWQPCDVGIQRVLKHEIHHTSCADIVAEVLQRLEALEAEALEATGSLDELDVSAIQLDKKIGVLRDRSMGWLVRAHEIVNHPKFVRKAFEHCQLDAEPHFNLSHASLTSSAALQALKNLSTSDLALWAEISQGRTDKSKPASQSEPDPSLSDDEDEAQELGDDLSIPSTTLHDHMLTGDSAFGRGFVANDKDTNHEFAQVADVMVDVEEGPSEPVKLGCGKWIKKPNQFYTAGKAFWEEL